MNKQIAIIATSLLCLLCALAPLRAQIVTNGSFESPDIPSGSFSQPSNTQGGWTYVQGAGFNDPISGFHSFEAPDGQQFALLQGSSLIFSDFSQTISLPSTGIFILSFFDAGRRVEKGGMTYNVFLDETVIFTDVTITNQPFELETVSFTGTAGDHILRYKVNPATQGQDQTAFFDAITIVPAPVLAGDYNNDGKVDAADYVAYRKNEGTMNVLPNDLIGGTIDADQYNQWRTNFGSMSMPGTGGGNGSSAGAVPEPSASFLIALGAVFVQWRQEAACPGKAKGRCGKRGHSTPVRHNICASPF